MGFFTAEQASALEGQTVRVATLVEFRFATGTMRVWNGTSALTTGGMTFAGLAGLGSISGLKNVQRPISAQATFTLSGVLPGLVNIALGDIVNVQGRWVVVYQQLFDEAWQGVGNPIPIWTGIMQPPRVTREAGASDTGAVQTVVVPAENPFFKRSRAPAGRFTDRDQKQRSPSDRFFEYVPQMVSKAVRWPQYDSHGN